MTYSISILFRISSDLPTNQKDSKSHGVKPRKSRQRHTSSSQANPLTRVKNELKGVAEADTSATTSDLDSAPESTMDEADDESSSCSDDDKKNKNKSKKVKDVCPLYHRGKCPHGFSGRKEVDGTMCKKEHPKRCFKYCKFGDKHKHGCKKGTKCEYHHPLLCKFSVKKRQCLNKDCKFVHLKGTKRREKPSEGSNQQTGKNGRKEPDKVVDESMKFTNFLELKKLVESMQATQVSLYSEIASVKASLVQPRPSFNYNPYSVYPMNVGHQFNPHAHAYQPQSQGQMKVQPGMTFTPPSNC